MPVVKIDMWSGRTEEQKEAIIKKVTDAIVESCGCPKEAVIVVINNIPKENFENIIREIDKLDKLPEAEIKNNLKITAFVVGLEDGISRLCFY